MHFIHNNLFFWPENLLELQQIEFGTFRWSNFFMADIMTHHDGENVLHFINESAGFPQWFNKLRERASRLTVAAITSYTCFDKSRYQLWERRVVVFWHFNASILWWCFSIFISLTRESLSVFRYLGERVLGADGAGSNERFGGAVQIFHTAFVISLFSRSAANPFPRETVFCLAAFGECRGRVLKGRNRNLWELFLAWLGKCYTVWLSEGKEATEHSNRFHARQPRWKTC